MNIVTEKINNDLNVNVDDSIWLGEEQMKKFSKVSLVDSVML